MSNSKAPIISFKDADILAGDETVVFGLNMEIFPGEFAYIVGKVGTGKTSIIKTMIREILPAKGSCQVCGYDIAKMKNREVPQLRRRIGVVFQDFKLLADRSVHDNLEFVLRATDWKDRAKIERRINEVLEAVGMQTKEHRMPHQLSGGEQQRIAIARAILNSPELIIADEPTGNLDSETSEGIMKLLRSINERGTAIVMITHSREVFQQHPGRVFVCENQTCKELELAEGVVDLGITI